MCNDTTVLLLLPLELLHQLGPRGHLGLDGDLAGDVGGQLCLMRVCGAGEYLWREYIRQGLRGYADSSELNVPRNRSKTLPK